MCTTPPEKQDVLHATADPPGSRAAPLTVVDAAAEPALVPPSPLRELHEWAHVGFAPVASDGPGLSVVHQVKGRLQEAREERECWVQDLGGLRNPHEIMAVGEVS